jgi:hypothetical protein
MFDTINGNGNHKPAQEPAADAPAEAVIKVKFDVARQDVALEFDTREFLTWAFVLATLDMARRKAEQMQRMVEVQQMQHQLAQQAQAQQIANGITLGKR